MWPTGRTELIPEFCFQTDEELIRNECDFSQEFEHGQ